MSTNSFVNFKLLRNGALMKVVPLNHSVVSMREPRPENESIAP